MAVWRAAPGSETASERGLGFRREGVPGGTAPGDAISGNMTGKERAILLRRIAVYPDQVQAVVAECAGLSEKARGLRVNPRGNLARETERFAGSLRTYDLALRFCLRHGNTLMTAMRTDQASLDAYLAAHPGDTTAAASSVILTQDLAVLSSTVTLCKDLSETVQTARRALATMKSQSQLSELATFALKLQTARLST